MIADNDLPVWTIRPNWREPLIERLSWMTDVLATSYGTEQRRALRLSPRREFEMLFNPVDRTRSYFELFLHRLGSQEFMLPLFHDSARMTAGIEAGALAIPVDTAFREFTAGGLAVILDGDDPLTFDKVSIISVANDAITVAAGGITRTWGKGVRVHPLRRSRLDQESAASALTSRVSEATIRFQLNQANDVADEGTWGLLLGGYPLMTDKPNWRESVDLDFTRNSLLLDNDHGLRELGDDAGRAFTVQTHSTMMTGRAAHWAFRQFLYRLRGQQGAIWVPSFKRDVELMQGASAGDLALDIKDIGYGYTGGAISGRTWLWFGGSATAEISGLDGPTAAGEERLALAAPLTEDLPLGAYGSFLDACRLSSDDIEIAHHTDTDGTAECNLAFRSFRDERVPPDPIDAPIPFGQLRTPDLCGAPDTAVCVPDLTGGSTGLAEDGSGDDPDGGGGPGPGAGDDLELGGYLYVEFSHALTSGTDPSFAAHPQFDLKLNGQSIASVTFADDTSARYMATILFGSEALKYHSLLDSENEETQDFYPLPLPALARTDAGADPTWGGGSNLPEYYVFQPGGSILNGLGMTIWDGCLAPSTNDTDGTPKIIGGGVTRHDDLAASPLNPLGENTLTVTVSNVISGKGATDDVSVYLVGEFFSRTLRSVDSGWRDGDGRVNDTPMYFQADADNDGGSSGASVSWWRAYNGLVPGAVLSPTPSDPSYDPDTVARVADLVFDLSK